MSSSEWKTYKFGEIYDVFSGLSKSRDQFGYGHPFVTFKDVFYNYFLPDKLTSLANTTEKEIKSCSVEKGDIFLTRTSETQHELGYSAVALKDYPNATFNGFTKRLRLKQDVDLKIDLHYLGYYCRSPFFRSQIAQFSSLTTRASLNSSNINALELRLPELSEQEQIGNILKSLDDKIELNRQTNQTLEAMAQALFKEMCLPKGDELPDGWKVGKLGDVMTLQRGYDLPTTTRTHGRYPVIAASGVNGFHNEFKNFAPGVTTGRSGVIGNVFYVQEDFWALNTSLFVKDFKIGDAIFSFFVLKSIDLASHNGGSAVPTLNRNHVHEVDVIIPTLQVIQTFSSQAVALYQQIKNNEQENQTLTSLRDGLLPKLMKGEILND